MSYYKKFRKLAFLIEPERAHQLAISSIKLGMKQPPIEDSATFSQTIFNRKFKNPIGLAAGFDKNGEVSNEILSSGFGFTEVGTVTPKPQKGNPKPRVFRLEEDNAVINRLGFNNDGMDVVYRRLDNLQKKGIIGINVGANKDSRDKINDYVICIDKFAKIADYLTINISSPNTLGLRDLQKGENFNLLLKTISEMKKNGLNTPILIKLAPELSNDDLKKIVSGSIAHNIDGLIISNTTISRDLLKSQKHTSEEGGLSGKPLMKKSTAMIKEVYKLSGGQLPIIGVGGIFSGQDIIEKMINGASLIQLYTAMIYEGPPLINNLKRELHNEINRLGVRSITEIIGTNVD